MILGIDPKIDYAFKRVFGNEKKPDILIHLINAVMARYGTKKIVAVEILNPFSTKEALDDKLSVLDIRARDESGRHFNIEMQMVVPASAASRFLYYWAKFHQSQLGSGDDYSLIRPTISILILNGILFPQIPDYYLPFEVANRQYGIVFSEDFQLHTMELPKFRKSPEELTDPLDIWCYFLRHAEELDTDRLPTILKVPQIERAMEELSVFTQDEIERARYEARLKQQRDESWLPKALRQDAINEGRAEGLSLGRAEGRDQGIQIGRVQIAQRLLGRSISSSADLENRPVEELRKLADELENELLNQRNSSGR